MNSKILLLKLLLVILSEARKFRLSLTIAHQYIKQIDESIRDAILETWEQCWLLGFQLMMLNF